MKRLLADSILTTKSEKALAIGDRGRMQLDLPDPQLTVTSRQLRHKTRSFIMQLCGLSPAVATIDECISLIDNVGPA